MLLDQCIIASSSFFIQCKMPTPHDRVLEHPESFWFEKGGKVLLCKFCHNKPIDHSKSSTISRHLKSDKHKQNKILFEKRRLLQPRLPAAGAPRPADLRDEVVKDWVAAIVEADIPMYRAGKLLPFLRKHLKYGGAIPRDESTLRCHHMPKVFEQHIRAVRNIIRHEKVAVVVDETTDRRDNSVLNVVVGKLLFFYY